MDPGRVCAIKSFLRNDSRHGHCIKIILTDPVSKPTQEALRFFRDHGPKDVLVTFGICGSVVPENSDLLSTLSPAWKTILDGHQIEPKQLQISRLDKDAFEVLVDLVLGQQASFDNLADLILLSDVGQIYQMENLSEKLEEEIIQHLTVDVVSELLSYWPSATKKLFTACRKIALMHFDKFIKTPSFTKVSNELLGSLIEDDALEAQSEEQVLDAVALWISANPKCPSDDCEALLRNVRLGLISNDHMVRSVSKLGPFAQVLREWMPLESSSSGDMPADLDDSDKDAEPVHEPRSSPPPPLLPTSSPRMTRTEAWDWSWYSEYASQHWFYHPENNVDITCLAARDEELVLIGTSVGLVQVLNPVKATTRFLQLFDYWTQIKHVAAWKEWAVAAVGAEARLWNLRTRDSLSLTRDQSKARNALTGSWGSGKRGGGGGGGGPGEVADEVRALVDAGEQLLVGHLRAIYVWSKASKRWACLHTKALDSDLRGLTASGGRAVSAMASEVIKVWDPADGADLMEIDCRDKPLCCMAAGEGYLIAICGRGIIHKWCLETGELVKSEPTFREQGGQRVRKGFVVVQGSHIITGVGRYLPTQDFDVCVRGMDTLEVAYVLRTTTQGCPGDALFGGQNVVGAFVDRRTVLWLAGRPFVPAENREGLAAMVGLRKRFVAPAAEGRLTGAESKWVSRLPWWRSTRKAQGRSRDKARSERPHEGVSVEEEPELAVDGGVEREEPEEVCRGVDEVEVEDSEETI